MAASSMKRTFELVDKATGPLRAISRSFREMGASGRKTLLMLRQMGQRLNLDRLARSFGAVGRAAGRALQPLRNMLGSLLALGGLGGAGSLVGIVRGFGASGDSIAKAADRLGLEIERYQELLYGAQASGFEGFDQSIRTLNQRIGDAVSGNKDLKQLFSDMGISLHDANGEVRTAGDLLPDIAEAFRVNESAITRTSIATKLFEAEGVGMINMLAGGRAGLAALSAEAQKNGVLTEEQARLASDQQDAIFALTRAWGGLTDLIGAELAPIIIPLIQSMREWINTNREFLVTEISGAIRGLVTALKQVDWRKLVGDARAFAASVKRVVEATIGWKGVLIAIVGVLASGMILNVGLLIVALGKLGFAALGVAGKLAVMMSAQVIGAIGSFVTAIGAGYKVMAAFNLVLAANPIGLLIVGIAALVAAGALLVYKWDWVKEQFVGNWRAMLPFLKLTPIGALISAGAWLVKNWEGVKTFFSGMWDSISETFRKGWESIQPIIEAMKTALKFTPVGALVAAGQAFFGEDGSAASGPGSPGGIVQQAARNNANRVDVSGAATLKVDFTNAPPGTRVTSRSEGVLMPQVNVGRAMQTP